MEQIVVLDLVAGRLEQAGGDDPRKPLGPVDAGVEHAIAYGIATVTGEDLEDCVWRSLLGDEATEQRAAELGEGGAGCLVNRPVDTCPTRGCR